MNNIPHIIEAALLLLIAFLLGCIIGWFLRAKIFKKRVNPVPPVAVEADTKSETQILETVSDTVTTPVKIAAVAVSDDKEPPKADEKPHGKPDKKTTSTSPTLNVVASEPSTVSIANHTSAKDTSAKDTSAKDTSVIGVTTKTEKISPPLDTNTSSSTEQINTGKPEALSAARSGGKDDLKKIKGVGPKLEDTLNSLGIYHFDQIANWKRAEIDWVDDYLSFKGRIDRDDWINQAKKFSS